jgi:hypothetical protein
MIGVSIQSLAVSHASPVDHERAADGYFKLTAECFNPEYKNRTRLFDGF